VRMPRCLECHTTHWIVVPSTAGIFRLDLILMCLWSFTLRSRLLYPLEHFVSFLGWMSIPQETDGVRSLTRNNLRKQTWPGANWLYIATCREVAPTQHLFLYPFKACRNSCTESATHIRIRRAPTGANIDEFDVWGAQTWHITIKSTIPARPQLGMFVVSNW
jgi:hypothetical protein